MTANNIMLQLRLTAVVLVIQLFSLPLGARPDTASTIDALKRLSLEELADLEVTSVSRHAEKLSEVASAIQVVTSDDIRRSGATSLPEALRLATNLQVAQIDSRQWAISARGFNDASANKLLVLMDGRTLYSPLHAAVFWDVQDTLLEDLDRIEVISGPGATQWGANAVNGVINITTKSAKDTPGLLVSGGRGSNLPHSVGLRYGGTLAPGLHYRIYGKAFSRDRTLFTDGRNGANDWSMEQGGFRLDWDGSTNDVFTLQGDLYSGSIGQPGGDDLTVRGSNVLGRWTRTVSDHASLMVQVYVDRTHRIIPGTFAEDLDIYDLDVQFQTKLSERHTLNLGAGFRVYDDREHNIYPVLAFLPAHVTRQQFSFSAQDEINLIPERLKLTLGSKFEHNYFTGLEIQPSVRTAWLASETQTLWAAISRAVRAPSRIDGELVAPRDPPHSQLQPNPNFKSETLVAYELGWRVQPKSDLAFTVSAFYSDYDQLRSSERLNPPSPNPFYLGNKQAGTVTGVEASADYRVTGRWRLRGGYTQMHLELHNHPDSTSLPPTNTDPEHQFTLHSSLDLPGNWQFDAAYRLIARITDIRLPAYDELDVRIGWHPTPALEWSLVGQNLLHAHHAEFNPATTRQSISRSIHAKVTWHY